MEYSKEIIGKNLRLEREKRSWSQVKIGKEIGVSGKQISIYEKGNIFPPLDILVKYCKIFDCELGYLLGEDSYSEKTALYTKISEITGLQIDTVNKLSEFKNKKASYDEFFYHNECSLYVDIINLLLSSSFFFDIIEELIKIIDLKRRLNACITKSCRGFSDEEINEALGLMDEVDEKKLSKIDIKIIKLRNDLSKILDDKEGLEYDTKIHKYELSEAFQNLRDEIIENIC